MVLLEELYPELLGVKIVVEVAVEERLELLEGEGIYDVFLLIVAIVGELVGVEDLPLAEDFRCGFLPGPSLDRLDAAVKVVREEVSAADVGGDGGRGSRRVPFVFLS